MPSPAGDVGSVGTGSVGTGSVGTGSMDGDRGSDILAVVPDDPATETAEPAGAATRRRDVVIAGHRGDDATVRDAGADPDPSVRAAALGALGRLGALGADDVVAAFADPSAVVRRRAAQEAATVDDGAIPVDAALERALGDPDPLVVEAACWAFGEREVPGAVTALGDVARSHQDMRCREAAVAALGAIGEPAGMAAVLAALDDKPTVRRRAVVALAAFDDPAADEALRRSLDDRDWQVRQAASVLLDDDSPEV
jgi:HEAT repeat protein